MVTLVYMDILGPRALGLIQIFNIVQIYILIIQMSIRLMMTSITGAFLSAA